MYASELSGTTNSPAGNFGGAVVYEEAIIVSQVSGDGVDELGQT
jgi:hypothetical protein